MLKKTFRNSIYSFAFGDAYGENPLNPYIWTDDTSLTLALIDALLEFKNPNTFSKNLYKNIKSYFEKGKYSPFYIPYKYGKTTYFSIKRKKGLKHEYSCGNGSAMRSLPIAFFFYNSSLKFRSKINHLQSKVTHAHYKVLMGCDIYVEFAHSLIRYKDKLKALKELKTKLFALCQYYKEPYKKYLKEYVEIFETNFYKRQYLKSSPFIVDTIKCVIYSVIRANSIVDALKISSKFIGDRDTICAMTMGLYAILEPLDLKYFKMLKANFLIKKFLNKVKFLGKQDEDKDENKDICYT